jgi:iron complex transport system substrate-binding protein
MRVVSLNCSNTEIVAALGRGEWLVGVDDDSDHPAELVAGLPRVGRDLDVDVAKVAALKPDLVLASDTVPGHDQVIARLREAELPFIAPETISFDDVLGDVRAIAERLGVRERGEALATAMETEVRGASGDVRFRREEDPRHRILVEWWPRPVIVPGRLSWVTDLIVAAGGVNPFGDDEVKSRPVLDEEVVAADPDAVVISWCGVKTEHYREDVVRARAAWASTTALRQGRIRRVPEAFLGRPGPRLVEGFRALRAIVEECRAWRSSASR